MKENASDFCKIKYDIPPTVLLVGNGINQCAHTDSWKTLLAKIAKEHFSDAEKEDIFRIPYSLQPVILTDDTVDEAMHRLSDDMISPMLSGIQQELYRKLLHLPADVILTTNYTYELEAAACPDFKVRRRSRCRYRHIAAARSADYLSLCRYMQVPFDTASDDPGKSASNIDRQIWHIHGEAALPSSMVLGHYYYGMQLAAIQGYLPVMRGCYNAMHFKRTSYVPQSWVDYFTYGNIYIIGQGLNFSEMDLWWLINYKKINGRSGSITWFEPNLDHHDRHDRHMRKLLAEVYGVNVLTEKVDSDAEYIEYYRRTITAIGEMTGTASPHLVCL